MVRPERSPRFDSKTRCISKTRTPPLISRLRRQLPPEGKPWSFANPPVRHAPLPLPLGEVSERSEDGEGQQGSPSQSPAATALPEGEPRSFCKKFLSSPTLERFTTHAKAGMLILSDNITLSKTESWTPANGTVLCLNGKTIRANGAGAAITVAQGKARFTDVPTSAYYAKAVAWAQKQDITDGVSQFRFAPEHDCTRAQIVTFLYRAFAE